MRKVYLHCDPSFVVSLKELDPQRCQLQQPLVTSRESTHHNIITELQEIDGKRCTILIIIMEVLDIVSVYESVCVVCKSGRGEREREREGEEGGGERGHLSSTECVLHSPVRT